MGFVSNTEVATLLGLGSTDPLVLSEIDNFLVPAIDAVYGFCNSDFDTVNAGFKTYNGNSEAIITTYCPVRSISKVEQNLGTKANPNWLDITDFIALQPSPTRLKDGAGNPLYSWIQFADFMNPISAFTLSMPQFAGSEQFFPPGLDNIKITGDFGFSTNSAPAGWKLAVALTVRHMMQARDNNEFVRMESGLGRTTAMNNERSAVLPEDIPREAQNLLKNFKYFDVGV